MPPSAMPGSDIRITYSELVAMLYSIFIRNGTSAEVGEVLAHNCAGAERDGAKSHGVFRMRGYVNSLRSGWVDGKVDFRAELAAPAYLRVDCALGFAQPAVSRLRARIVELARAQGIALVALRNSHHFGALWPDVEPFAADGLVAMAFLNSVKRVVPHGGHAPVYGTNPMAFAVPRAGTRPIVFDQASSAMAYGDIKIAARDGHPIPPGSGVDKHGIETTDPAAIVDGGHLLPFGSYKGSSIAMMVEVLAAAVTGGQFSFEVDWSAHSGAEIPRTGELLILIDPDLADAIFADRIETLVATLRQAGQDRLPADRRYRNRDATERHGIPLSADEMASLRALQA